MTKQQKQINVGSIYYNEDTSLLKAWTACSWDTVSTIPLQKIIVKHCYE